MNRSFLAGAAALAIVFAPVGAAYAQMGADAAAIGSGGLVRAAPGAGEATDGAESDASNVPGSRVGPESGSRISTIGQCNANKMAFRTETSEVQTTSEDFVNLPDSHRVITVGAGGCIVLTVTAELASQVNNQIRLRARIQGGPVAEPPSMLMGQQSSFAYFTGTAQFVFTNLPAGNHVVRLFWQSSNGTEIFARNRMIKYEYR